MVKSALNQDVCCLSLACAEYPQIQPSTQGQVFINLLRRTAVLKLHLEQKSHKAIHALVSAKDQGHRIQLVLTLVL